MLVSELRLLFGRARTRVLLVVLACIPVLLAVAVRLSGGPARDEGPDFLSQVSHNGVFAALAGLTVTLPFFLPLAVAMVAGDSVAGEAGFGTLRALLFRPVGRSRLLATKYATAGLFCLAATFVIAAAGLLAGAVLFPIGPVTMLSGATVPLREGVMRTLGAAGVVGLSMLGLAAIGLFVSTLTESAMAAMAVTAGVAISSEILDAIPQLHAIQPALFTHRWTAFGDLLRTSGGLGNIQHDLFLQVAWALVFGLAAWARFTTKDVLA
jgi:ABC-2 type transport system permease protein